MHGETGKELGLNINSKKIYYEHFRKDFTIQNKGSRNHPE